MKKKASTASIKYAGFSLPELLVVIAVLSLLMAGVFGVLSTSLRSIQFTSDQGANVQVSRIVLNAITDEIRNATAVTTPAYVSGTAQTSLYLDYTSPDTTYSSRRIIMSGHNVVILNRTDNTVIKTYGQGRVKTGSLQFTRSADSRRVFTVNFILKDNSMANAVETPVTTMVTTMNSDT